MTSVSKLTETDKKNDIVIKKGKILSLPLFQSYLEQRYSLFLSDKNYIMDIFLSSVLIVSLAAMAVMISLRRLRADSADCKLFKLVPCFLACGIVLVILNLAVGGNVAVRLVADVSWMMLPMMVLHLSIYPDESRMKAFLLCMLSVSIPLLHHVLRLFNVFTVLPEWAYLLTAAFVATAVPIAFIVLLWKRMSDMRAIMHSGTVWSFVCICVDSVYCLSMSVSVLGGTAVSMASGDYDGAHVYACLILLILQLAALCLRTALDSEFVIRQKREMMIVESMKVSQMEFSATSSKLDEIYKDIYERVVLHFEMEKPFLNGNLSINDVVRVVYSNKVYISKAICHYTGRNFCQFVNYYRVIYSMEIFRKQPGLKVAELAGLSGFNCTVSFTTAFRLFMNETPSEWCRKERTKLLKTKN